MATDLDVCQKRLWKLRSAGAAVKSHATGYRDEAPVDFAFTDASRARYQNTLFALRRRMRDQPALRPGLSSAVVTKCAKNKLHADCWDSRHSMTHAQTLHRSLVPVARLREGVGALVLSNPRTSIMALVNTPCLRCYTPRAALERNNTRTRQSSNVRPNAELETGMHTCRR